MTEQRITGRKTVWQHHSKAFRVDELTVETEGANPIQWATFERGDAVAALIVNTDTNHVLLIQQFRPPIASIEGPDHKLMETVAGIVLQNEEIPQSLAREIEEETGYEVPFNAATGNLQGSEFICMFYTSPGGSSERIYLYYVPVDSSTPKNAGGGMREQGERIEPVLMPLSEFFDAIDHGTFKDPKTIIAGQWLAKRWGNRRTDSLNKQEFEFVDEKTGKRRIIGYYIGDIGDVRDVDIWVNSSNSEFLMDSIYHRTLSSRIRTLGAQTSGDVMVDDTIQRALDRALGLGKGTGIGNVLDTESGALARTHNVRRLLHVASIKARIDAKGFARTVTSPNELVKCVVRSLEKCDELNTRTMGLWTRLRHGKYKSVLLPLFGAGIDRDSIEFGTQKICNSLIPAAIDYFRENPDSAVERVYFLAFTPVEVEVCDSVLSRITTLERLKSGGIAGSPAPEHGA